MYLRHLGILGQQRMRFNDKHVRNHAAQLTMAYEVGASSPRTVCATPRHAEADMGACFLTNIAASRVIRETTERDESVSVPSAHDEVSGPRE